MNLNARGEPTTFGNVCAGSSEMWPSWVDSVRVSDRVLSDTVWVSAEALVSVYLPDTVLPAGPDRSSWFTPRWLVLLTSPTPVAVLGTLLLPGAGIDSAALTAANASTSPAPCSKAG